MIEVGDVGDVTDCRLSSTYNSREKYLVSGSSMIASSIIAISIITEQSVVGASSSRIKK